MPTRCLFVYEKELGNHSETLALIGKKHDFHTIANISIALAPMGHLRDER